MSGKWPTAILSSASDNIGHFSTSGNHCITCYCHFSVYTMQLMLECKNYATKGWSSIKKKEFTFNDVGREAFGFPGKFAVDLNVIFCNLGVCAGYIIFIASNLQASCCTVYPIALFEGKLLNCIHIHPMFYRPPI